MAELRTRFRPEFLNRIDDIVVFKPLAIEQIVDLQFDRLRTRLAERGFVVSITEPARRLGRYIAHEVKTRIARAVLAGEPHDGLLVWVDVADHELAVTLT